MRRAPLTLLAQEWIVQAIAPGDTVLDATVGNGHDTLFLAERVAPGGCVWGLDIQQAALDAARERLAAVTDLRLELRLLGHEHLSSLNTGALKAAMFNLGYLPGSSHTVVTRPDTTCRALEQVVARLRPGGRCSILAYIGHPGGAEEADAVRQWCATLEPGRFLWRAGNPPGTPDTAPRLHLIERME
ncbi:MAG: methyltransferase domain-containing protein [Ectothiorhodospiraceae bacterium]|nr:methyltransferase domain-containing protein [Ectothiorhodospiraceae bacterium]MCH8504746.1 methyltransferase domain-containing protein [Ectothiorhodospiraceae bacterium]